MNNQKLSAIKCICFDVDGTLYDIRSMRKNMAKEIFISFFLKKITIQEICILYNYRKMLETLREGVRITNQTLYQLHISKIVEKMRCTSEMVDQIVNKWMIDVPCRKIHNYTWSGTKETLLKLKNKGYHLAILSDYPTNKKIKALGFDDIFEVTISCQDQDSDNYKPNTNGFLKIVKHFNINPWDCIYVGDSFELDVKGALENQIHAILFNPYNKKIKKQPYKFTMIKKFPDIALVLP